MSRKIDLTGKRFGKLTVIGEAGHRGKELAWLCQCDCGNKTVVIGNNLKRGHTKSCGCLQVTHKATGTRLYTIWQRMKDRTLNKNSHAYGRYGKRGITLCDEWRDSFEAFRDWALSNGYKDTLSVDRIDNNRGYSPDNCRWVNVKTQSNNRSSCHLLTYNGETKNVTQWAETIGMNPVTLESRIISGWSIEKALSTPVRKRG